MTRGLTTAATTAVTSEVVTRTMAVQLDFPAGVVRYSSAPFDLIIGGQTFLGVGVLGSISAVEESAELRSAGLVVQLSGIPRDLVAVALQQQYQGRRATVWEVPLDASGAPVADPIIIFRGRMDQMEGTLGETATLRLRLENRLADWERPNLSRFTNEEQQRLHPGDRFFEFLPAATEKELVWPARTFFR